MATLGEQRGNVSSGLKMLYKEHVSLRSFRRREKEDRCTLRSLDTRLTDGGRWWQLIAKHQATDHSINHLRLTLFCRGVLKDDAE